ncbi:olfactory protein-like [Crotalus adamanteus]|uniref:Olfactory protein-like n=1 Tax=Crotalus adamanteus TaxID=8729 RepID=A0AAW1AR60_CROAD
MHQGRMRLFWLSALGLAFLCLPTAASDDSNPCAPGQLLGQWFVLGIGSNCEWLVQFVAKEIMTANISSQDEGSFTVATSFMTDYGSMDIEMTYTKQENGMYLHKSEWGDKIIERRKTDCKTYAMTCVKDVKESDGKFCKFVSLYGKQDDVCGRACVAGIPRLHYGNADRQRAGILLDQERCRCKIHLAESLGEDLHAGGTVSGESTLTGDGDTIVLAPDSQDLAPLPRGAKGDGPLKTQEAPGQRGREAPMGPEEPGSRRMALGILGHPLISGVQSGLALAQVRRTFPFLIAMSGFLKAAVQAGALRMPWRLSPIPKTPASSSGHQERRGAPPAPA